MISNDILLPFVAMNINFYPSIALVEIGGFENLYLEYMTAVPNSTLQGETACGIPQETAWHIFRPANDPNYPWPGVIFGITLLSAYFFCTNQVNLKSSLFVANMCKEIDGS